MDSPPVTDEVLLVEDCKESQLDGGRTRRKIITRRKRGTRWNVRRQRTRLK